MTNQVGDGASRRQSGTVEEDDLENISLMDSPGTRRASPRTSPRAAAPAPPSPAVVHAAATKALLIGVAALLIASTGVCIRQAEVDGEIPYSPMSVTLFSELAKLGLSVAATAFSDDAAPPCDRRAALLFLPGAVGYLLVNNVRYFMLEQVNPGLLAVVWNLKICIIGVLYALPPFRRLFSPNQLFGALLLVAGSTLAEVSQWGSTDEVGRKNTGGVAGLELVAFALTLTSMSAVATEYAYKRTALPLCRQNVILYSYGALLNLATFVGWRLYSGGDLAHPTRGFTGWTWAVVAAQASAGYAIGALLKHVDAVGQVFADVVAMLFSVAVAFLLFDLAMNWQYAVALFVCSASLGVYYWDLVKAALDARSAASKDASAAERRAREADARADGALGFWATRSPLVVADPKPSVSVELTEARRLGAQRDAESGGGSAGS